MRRVTKYISKLFVIVCILTAALMPLSVRAQSGVCDGTGPEDVEVITVVNKNGPSDIQITCVSHNGPTWTYEVKELVIKNGLSHWVLGIVTCLDNVISSSPQANDIGKDGNRDFYGIKWETGESFTSGLFSFTLDDDYPASLMPLEALAKAGKEYAVGNITGPDCSVTAIELASFSAIREGSTVSLVWETAVEIDNAGFNLYRAAAPNAPLVKINEQLIAATGSGSQYSFSDVVDSSEYYYVLEDIDTSGVATRHVPLARVAQSLDRLFLPLIGDTN
jgi:hypothetical protein